MMHQQGGAIMPWQEVSTVSLRQEFVALASRPGANKRELARRYAISPQTAYKWLRRAAAEPELPLLDRSRRPLHSPARTPTHVEEAVLALRAAHPAWGARKLRARLLATNQLPAAQLPAASTITAILRRHGQLDPAESRKHKPHQRFEHAAPNQLWQMDFKGHFAMRDGRCHALTVLDDHSRFLLCLAACADEQAGTVREQLTAVFERYGLPERLLTDNGSPWGGGVGAVWTGLTVWLVRLDIKLVHGRPYHPQTQGKDERLHRTLKAEVLRDNHYADLGSVQAAFEPWRQMYNLERPHEALDMAVPASRYKVSWRKMPGELAPVEYGPGDIVRKVQDGGIIHYRNKEYLVGKAFKGYPVGLRASNVDGLLEVYFCQQKIGEIDLRAEAVTL
jgi:transposase InsO family protein